MDTPRGGDCIALTFFIVVAWFSMLCFICLPKKLPAVTNVLLYMGLAIIDINKLTILAFRLRRFEISNDVPDFLTMVIHRDITFSISLLAFANVYLTAKTMNVKLIATVCAFFFIFSTGQALRLFNVMTYHKWGISQEIVLIFTLMIISLLLGKLFQSMVARGKMSHEQYL